MKNSPRHFKTKKNCAGEKVTNTMILKRDCMKGIKRHNLIFDKSWSVEDDQECKNKYWGNLF